MIPKQAKLQNPPLKSYLLVKAVGFHANSCRRVYQTQLGASKIWVFIDFQSPVLKN
jgi:hypothetical protein